MNNLKDELIKRLLQTVYKDDINKKQTIEYLNGLSEDTLEDLINSYNLIGIKDVSPAKHK